MQRQRQILELKYEEPKMTIEKHFIYEVLSFRGAEGVPQALRFVKTDFGTLESIRRKAKIGDLPLGRYVIFPRSFGDKTRYFSVNAFDIENRRRAIERRKWKYGESKRRQLNAR